MTFAVRKFTPFLATETWGAGQSIDTRDEKTYLCHTLNIEGLLSDIGTAMRIEATIPKARGQALNELAEELSLSRSQILDEALALFLNAVMEVRRGRRLVSLGATGTDTPREIVTPTLAQMEWTAHRHTIRLSEAEMQKVVDLVNQAPEPPEALKKLMQSRV